MVQQKKKAFTQRYLNAAYVIMLHADQIKLSIDSIA